MGMASHDADENSMTEEFLKLYTDSQRRMYAYLRTQVFNSQDADDVFQDAAVILWRNFDQYDRSKDFTRWACGIIHNQVLAYHRHHRQFLTVFREEVADAVGEDMLRVSETASERLDLLRQCMEKLAPLAQDMLRRRYRTNKPVKELALELGRTESAIHKSLKRIHEVLRACIESGLAPRRTTLP
jgi:RNA polymerase sigma-70 factor (ECF subfamily)